MAEAHSATFTLGKAFQLFGHICMGSMILSVWDPSLMAWAGNFLTHSFSGYANLPVALKGLFGAAVDPTQIVAAGASHHAGMAGTMSMAQGAGAAHIAAAPGVMPDLGTSWMQALSPDLQTQFSALGSDVMGKFNHLSGGMQQQFLEQLPIYQNNGLSLSDAINAFCIK
jgi:hypothetical protein